MAHKAAEERGGDRSAGSLAMNPVTLTFTSKAAENEYLQRNSRDRYDVLKKVLIFDVLTFVGRIAGFLLGPPALRSTGPTGTHPATHLLVMSLFWSAVTLMNARSRGLKRRGNFHRSPNAMAARQEEAFLSLVATTALCTVMLTISSGASGSGSSQHDSKGMQAPLSSFIIIVLGTLLELRWWNPTILLAIPVLLFSQRVLSEDGWPLDALVHVCMAWAAGALMSYSSDQKRRQVFAKHKRAQAAASARAAAEAQTAFMRIMCHEVRTPLQGCIVSAEMLQQHTNLSEEQAELVRTVDVSSRALLMTVSGFLDYFKLNAGKQLERGESEVNVKQLCTDVHRIADKLIAGNPNVFVYKPEVCDDVPSSFVSDEHRLMGVLLNLISNACKNTERGHVSVRISSLDTNIPEAPGVVASSRDNNITAVCNKEEDDEFDEEMREQVDDEKEDEDVGARLGRSSGPSCSSGSNSKDETPSEAVATTSSSSYSPNVCKQQQQQQQHQHHRSSSEGRLWRGQKHGDYILFEVSDTGCGINPSSLEHIFKDYLQSSKAERNRENSKKRPKQGGTGLGLSISKRQVANALGGRIGVRSAPGVGSTFWFTVLIRSSSSEQRVYSASTLDEGVEQGQQKIESRFQTATQSNQQLQHSGEQYLKSQAQAPYDDDWKVAVQQQVRGSKVLLAEDNRQNRMIMCRMIRGTGLECEDVANGQEAVEAVKRVGSSGYLAVFMDKEMPELDGWEATRRIRAMGVHNMPVIGVTAHFECDDGKSSGERSECMRAGCNDMVTKPLTRQKLMSVLAAIVQHQRGFVHEHINASEEAAQGKGH